MTVYRPPYFVPWNGASWGIWAMKERAGVACVAKVRDSIMIGVIDGDNWTEIKFLWSNFSYSRHVNNSHKTAFCSQIEAIKFRVRRYLD